MSTHTYILRKCDRCHKVTDSEHWTGGSVYKVCATVEHDRMAGGSVLTFRDLCEPCNEAVRVELEAMLASARTARQGKAMSERTVQLMPLKEVVAGLQEMKRVATWGRHLCEPDMLAFYEEQERLYLSALALLNATHGLPAPPPAS